MSKLAKVGWVATLAFPVILAGSIFYVAQDAKEGIDEFEGGGGGGAIVMPTKDPSIYKTSSATETANAPISSPTVEKWSWTHDGTYEVGAIDGIEPGRYSYKTKARDTFGGTGVWMFCPVIKCTVANALDSNAVPYGSTGELTIGPDVPYVMLTGLDLSTAAE